jgi:hypothetical protein
MDEYDLENAPPDVVGGILGHNSWTKCDHCKEQILIELINPQYRVRIREEEE